MAGGNLQQHAITRYCRNGLRGASLPNMLLFKCAPHWIMWAFAVLLDRVACLRTAVRHRGLGADIRVQETAHDSICSILHLHTDMLDALGCSGCVLRCRWGAQARQWCCHTMCRHMLACQLKHQIYSHPHDPGPTLAAPHPLAASGLRENALCQRATSKASCQKMHGMFP